MVLKMSVVGFNVLKDTAKPRLAPGMMSLGKAIADAIRGRVRDQGRPVDQAKPDIKGSRLSTAHYANDAGVSDATFWGDSGAIVASKRQFKRKFDRKSFANTGGMWEGLRVRPKGRNVVIRFMSRSLGAEVHWRPKATWRKGDTPIKFAGRQHRAEQKNLATVGTKRRAKGLKESNALKAWTVLDKGKVHVLKITQRERTSISNALILMQKRALEKMFTGRSRWTMALQPDDAKLRAKILASADVPQA